jgi:hypothetical protein
MQISEVWPSLKKAFAVKCSRSELQFMADFSFAET